MKVKHLISVALIGICYSSYGQLNNIDNFQTTNGDFNLDTVAWIHNGTFVLGINEGMLHNWSAGGELASLTVNSILNGNLTYYHHRHIWSTTLEAAYGLLYAYSNDFIPRKTDDRFDLTSKYGYRLSPTKDLYFTTLINVKTQFTKGYNYDDTNWQSYSTSNILSPLYITTSPGIEYRKGTRFSLFLSPIGVRNTFVKREYTLESTSGAFGVKYGKTFKFELGAYLTTKYQVDLSKNINFRSRLDLFCNYLAKNTYDSAGNLVSKDSPKNIYVYFDNFMTIKLIKFLSVNLGLTMIYDNNYPYVNSGTKDPLKKLGWLQVKQIANIGFNYTF